MLVCQYDLNRFSAEIILGVVRTHPLVIYRGDVCRNPYYVPPDEFLTPNRAAVELDRLLSNIRDYRQAQLAIIAGEPTCPSTFQNSPLVSPLSQFPRPFLSP